jgi:hypothetical protein
MEKWIFMKTICVVCFVISSMVAKSQTYDEWVNQKKTKLKYIAEQIAAFEEYGDFLDKGYDILKNGLFGIDSIKNDDYNLHSGFFTSLKEVKPSIADYAETYNILTLLLQILQVNQNIGQYIINNASIQPQERDYINKVMSSLLEKCSNSLDQFIMLTTNGITGMKDDERLKRIDGLYADMKSKYRFSKYFENSIHSISISREKELINTKKIKSLYSIK